MLDISYFAMAQLEAAVEHPPALKAIFPVDHTISSASRLLFPVLDESDGGLDA